MNLSVFKYFSFSVLIALIVFTSSIHAQEVERDLPKEWEALVNGGRFMDLFLPLPEVGKKTSDVWGQDAVKPRYQDNGIEDSIWSYWGGNIHVDSAGTYNLFVCRWLEDNPKGHMAWPSSIVVHASSDKPHGPYKVQRTIGSGHNPEMHQLKDGRFFLYVNKFSNDTYYLANQLEGPWEELPFIYDSRQRQIDQHLANNTFAKRDDGSMLMVSRGGGVWISETGLPPYSQITSSSVYPPYEGNYEDPVVWRDHIQYHLIVNDWSGRIAYYLRSKDGVSWKLDAGEAYRPGIAVHQDGTVEDWYKFERIKMLQDEYGRAYQANFAVCDTIKREDLGNDNHSSKNICIPLTVGRLIELVNSEEIDSTTKEIKLLVKAESNFDPHKDIDIKSLRFGASEEVDYGRGCTVVKTEKVGRDLLLAFNGKGNGFSDQDFAAKLLGKTKKGELLFGFARLPWLEYIEPILSSKFPELSLNGQKLKVDVEIENFGQVKSDPVDVLVEFFVNDKWEVFSHGEVPQLAPYEKTFLAFWGANVGERNDAVLVRVSLKQQEQVLEAVEGPVIIR